MIPSAADQNRLVTPESQSRHIVAYVEGTRGGKVVFYSNGEITFSVPGEPDGCWKATGAASPLIFSHEFCRRAVILDNETLLKSLGRVQFGEGGRFDRGGYAGI